MGLPSAPAYVSASPFLVAEFIEDLRLEILGGERVILSTVNLDEEDARELRQLIDAEPTLRAAVEFHP